MDGGCTDERADVTGRAGGKPRRPAHEAPGSARNLGKSTESGSGGDDVVDEQYPRTCRQRLTNNVIRTAASVQIRQVQRQA